VSFRFSTVQHLAEALLFSHPMPVGIGYWFHGFFHTLCHYAYGSLRIVEAQVLWITKGHGIVLECWRSGFVSSMCFLRVSFSFGSVWLLSLRRRYISPSLSLASLAHKSQRVSILHPPHCHSEPIALALLFAPSSVFSLGSNKACQYIHSAPTIDHFFHSYKLDSQNRYLNSTYAIQYTPTRAQNLKQTELFELPKHKSQVKLALVRLDQNSFFL